MTAALGVDDRKLLGTRVMKVMSTAGCIGHARAAAIAAECGGAVTEQHVVDALVARGVRVAELPALPAGPPAAMPPGLLEQVAQLRLRLSLQVVFGNEVLDTFRVIGGVVLANGRRLDAAAVQAAQRQAATLPAGPDRELREAVLADLAVAAQESGALDAIVLWEVVRLLRAHRRDIDATQLQLRTHAGTLDVVRDEADLLAAAVVAEAEAAEGSRSPEERVPTGSGEAPGPAPTAVPRQPGPSPRAVPDPRPAPVEPPDLQIRPGRAGHVTVTWTLPQGGTVELRRAAEQPRWRRGSTVTIAELNGHGRAEPTVDAVPTADGRMRREVAAPEEPTYLTAFTRTRTAAVVGPTVQLTAAAPVRLLEARRLQHEARLRWVWPEGAVAAMVEWRPDGVPHAAAAAGSVRCSKRAFVDGGGLALAVGYGAVVVSVRAAYGFETRQLLAPPVELRLPAVGVPVRYRFLPDRRLPLVGPRRHRLELVARAACTLPDLVVVEGRDRRPPPAPEAGVTVARLDGRPLAADEAVLLTVTPPERGPSWLVLHVAPDAEGADGVLLEPPPTPELWRR